MSKILPSPAVAELPPPPLRSVLYVLALCYDGKHKTGLVELLRALQVRATTTRLLDASNLGPLLQQLQQGGWVTQDGGCYRLAADRLHRVLRQLAQDGASATVFTILQPLLQRSSGWGGGGAGGRWPQLWQALLHGSQEALQQALVYWRQLGDDYGRRLLADDDGRALLACLPQDKQHLLLLDVLLDDSWRLRGSSEAYRLLLAQQDAGVQLPATLADQMWQLALWRDDDAQLAHHGTAALSRCSQLLLLLRGGQAADACLLLDDWQAAARRASGKRKLELSPDEQLLCCLALLGSGDAARLKPLRTLVNQGLKQRLGLVYLPLDRLLAKLEGKPEVDLPARWPPLLGVSGLVLALALYWSDAPNAQDGAWRLQLLQFRSQLQQDGYLATAQEVDALLAAQYGVPRPEPDWHAQRSLTPLVALYQRQEAWQHALSALALLAPGAARGDKPESASRLVWLVSVGRFGVQLEPREQKRSAKGVWSKGRAVAIRRLAEDGAKLDFLCEQDRRVLRHIRRGHDYYGPQYELDDIAALAELVGHPAVYWLEAPETRVELLAGQPALQLKERGGQLRLTLQPEQIDADASIVWHTETPTRLTVYPVSKEVRQVAAIVGQGLSVPAAGKAQLLKALGAIAPLLPVHSDLPELAANIDSVAADGRLYAHLLPLEEGLRLQLLVRPLAEGGWYAPGKGMETLLGEQDGKPVQTRRALAAEKAALQTVLAACPQLADADSDGREWQLAEPQAALAVLAELQQLPATLLQCVWPEGERMRLKGQHGLAQTRFALTRQGDWFALSGVLTLDDGRVLQLKQLLALLRQAPGRFVQLDERDWLALDGALRRRLEQLALLGDADGDGLKLGALTAPLLAELAAEAGDFQADAAWQQQLATLASLRDWQPTLPSTLQAELRDYQRDGYVWLARLARWGVGACLADDMGLGKTVQTLALLLARAPQGPQLVVAPTSVAMNWLAEAARFAPTLQLQPYHQQRELAAVGPFTLVVTSYGLLQQDADAFAAVRWHSVVLDEAQAIKNATTKRAQAVLRLQADCRLALSGTPLENHLGELWNLFRFLNPGLLGSQQRFNERFAGPIERGDKAVRGALKALLQPFLLRRTKRQVLDELPPRTEITQLVTLSDAERHLYEALRQQAVDRLAAPQDEDGAQPLQVLAEITRLRRFCCQPRLVLPDCGLSGSKLAAFGDIVAELLDNGHKALVFSQFVDHLAIVRDWLDGQGIAYQYLDGATPARERQERVDAFQAGDGEVFLISLKAGGSGLNLTAADYVIHLDPWWNPAVEDQASDRAHRIGQQRPVTIYRLVAEHTIEEEIVALHARKRDLADSLLQGGDIGARLDADALLALLRGAGAG